MQPPKVLVTLRLACLCCIACCAILWMPGVLTNVFQQPMGPRKAEGRMGGVIVAGVQTCDQSINSELEARLMQVFGKQGASVLI